MKTTLLTGAALAALSIPALAADMPVKAPRMAAPAFTWTSCFLGAHAGGGWTKHDISDPVQLVQDSLGLTTTGVTTTSINPSGAVIGGQFGCDYQFAPNWVIGVEGAASGSTMKGSNSVLLPASAPNTALVTARTDFLASATARFGYAIDHWLLFARGGAAWAGNKYSVTGTAGGAPFGFEGLDSRPGWTVGAGIAWAFATNWSAALEYDYYGFGTRTVSLTDTVNGGVSPLGIKQSAQTVKIGVNFHMWGGQ